jgi:putative ABC transport system permease protein
MAMSVRERIKEVGVLKTLGFTNGAILGIIIGEAATIALIGGIIGVLLASGLTIFVGKFAETFNSQLIGLSITMPVALFCIGVALLVGIISSFIPALNASRTNILDSLRYAG